MGMTKTIEIDGQEVQFRASAAIPRMYRIKYRRDIFADLNELNRSVNSGDKGASALDIPSLEMFENIAYLMAKHADSTVPDSIDDWLDGFNTFSIYKVLPEIVSLWGENMETQSESKKK